MTQSRVAIVAERLEEPYCGLGQFCLHLGRALAACSSGIEPLLLVPAARRSLLAEARFTHALSRRVRWWPESGPRADLWHLTHQDTRHRAPLGTPFVLTVHDLNFLSEKSAREARRRLRRLQRRLDRASAVAVPSRFTLGELRRCLDLSAVDVEVIPNGIVTGADQPERPPFAPDGPFFFSVGQVVAKKNLEVLVDFLARFDRHVLVIAGRGDGAYADSIRQRAAELGVGRRVILPGAIADRHRDWLYRECEAFLFPSLREGFGLPVLEAMSFGTPVLAAQRGSLPEVGGEEADYWHDFEPESMVAAYERAKRRWQVEVGLRERRRRRAARFKWSAAAEGYLRLYRRCVESEHRLQPVARV